MTTIIINEKTKVGKNILELLKVLSKADKNGSVRFLDETEYLMSSKANKDVLTYGVSQIQKGEKGKTIKISELWK